jgi:hypothetical protein
MTEHHSNYQWSPELEELMEADEVDRQIAKGVEELIHTVQERILSKRLNDPVYREMGLLLDLLPYIDLTNNIDLLHLAKFAASLLIAESESDPVEVVKPPDPVQPVSLLSNWGQVFLGEEKVSGNILLARKIRKSIASEIRLYRSPLFAVLRANGSPATQLVSGLTWFFLVFVITPSLAAFLMITVRSRVERNYASGFNLGFDVGYNLAAQQADETLERSMSEFADDDREADGQVLPSGSAPSGVVPTTPVTTTGPSSGPVQMQSDPAEGGRLGSQQPLFSQEEINRMFLVVVSGSLGSVVSVMVRLRSVDAQNRAKSMAPFFSGFFKPIIGTAFALFIVALFETNIVSFPSIQSGTPQKYLYVALAFTAGFSEILVPDILTKTERSISGASSLSKLKR